MNCKKIISVLVWLLLFLTNSISQNATYIIPMDSKNSIVREFAKNAFIVYNTDGITGTLNYADLNSNIVVSAQVPPVDVADFEIHEGILYFCGTAFGSPIAGMFDVIDLFFYGGQVDYTLLPNAISCVLYTSETDIVTSLKKIELMPVDGDKPHLIMIGESRCTYAPISDSVNRCIIDLYYDGTDWISAVSQAHDNIMYYDDVAVTDNHVVTAGHKHNAEGEYILVFDRLTPSNQNIFDQSGPSVIFFFAGGVAPYAPFTDEEFLIEHISGDYIATVCHGNRYVGTTLYEGTVLNLYIASTTAVTVANRYMVSEHSKQYCDLKYNPTSNSLYLLPGALSTCPESYLEFILDNAKPSVIGALKHTDISLSNQSFASMDATPLSLLPTLGQAILSGESNGRLHLWRHLRTETFDCHNEIELPLSIMAPDFTNTLYLTPYSKATQPFLHINPPVEIIKANIICSE